MKFHGVVGVATSQVESGVDTGVRIDVIEERQATGDTTRNTRQISNPDKVNFDATMSTSISVLADVFSDVNFTAIRYCKWAGVNWVVTNVEPVHPRLLLTLGGVYDGPTPEPPDSP